ncbi:MAG: tyrosine-type recombinase/integrase [Nitriliruptoraceae bacterium]|nr:tyrosine-type recombinase/integrase [Nitriliruptoraceae bacterium]
MSTFMDYEDYLRGRGLSPTTVRIYSGRVRQLLRWCYAQGIEPERLTRLNLRDYCDTMPDTWASRRSARSAIGHWIAFEGRTEPIHEAILVPRKPRMRSRALTHDEARRLQAAALMVGGREGVATLCGLYLAARRTEIAMLTWDGYAGGRFRFTRTKTHDVHEVPVHPTLAEALDRYKASAGGGLYLFPGDRGRPHVVPTTVWEWVKGIGRAAGIEVHTHQLRATALTTVLEATGNLRAAQELAGHQDPSVTAGYTRVSDQMMRDAVGSLDFGQESDT